MTNTKLLEEAIQASGLKRSFIAEQLGLSTYGLALKINNESEFKGSEIVKICAILKIDPERREAIFFDLGVDFKSTEADGGGAP